MKETTKQRVLILGGVATGAAAATRLSRESKDFEITIVEKSSKTSFSNCGLPYGISNGVPVERLAPKDNSHLENKGIKVLVGHEAISINEESKTVTIKNVSSSKKSELEYDKLIVATGASAINLPILGLDKEKDVYSLRTHDDLARIAGAVKGKTKALVIGAGFIGVEITEVLRDMGLHVNLVEMGSRVAGFDLDFSSYLEQKIKDNGVNIMVNSQVSEVKPKEKKFIIGEEEYFYDIIFTTGIKPNTEIFEGTSVKLDGKGVVITDKYMRTSNKDIYAGGDIVYTPSVVTGHSMYSPMARNAKTQGRVIADHIAGIKSNGQFPTSGATGLPVFGTTASRAGLTERQAKGAGFKTRIVFATTASNASYVPSGSVVMKLVFDEKSERVLGLQAFGKNADKIVDAFTVAVTAKMKLRDLEALDLVYQPHLSTTLSPLNIIANIAINELRFNFSSICPKELLESKTKYKVIDTRDAKQHKEKGHLEGAINIPTKDLSIETVGPDMEREIAVHCNSGFGSSVAARKLKELGYKNVFNAAGGNNLYQAMKHKIDKN